MDQFHDILYLLEFFALAGITGVAFYIWGQLWDRSGYRKKTRALIQAIGRHKRLASELRYETSVHRDIAEQCREALDEREEYWLAVKKRWRSEAERAKQIISQQEEIRTKHAISLKEANRKLMAIENDFQMTKHENEIQINTLKSSQGDPEKLKKLEAESKKINQKFSAEIEAKKAKIAELQQGVKKRDEKLGKLENIILKKNNDLNELKRKLEQSSALERKLATTSDSLKERERGYEAIKLDLKARNESLAELQRELHAAKSEIAERSENSSVVDDLEEIRKTVFIKETQLLEKESAMKKLAADLDQKKHLVSQLQTDINARNQKLTALKSQMEDRSELDEALEQIKKLHQDAKSREQQVTSLRGQLEETEQELEKHRELVTELRAQGGSKDASIQNLTSDLGKKDTQVATLQTQLKSKVSEIQKLILDAKTSKQGMVSLEALLGQRDKKIEVLTAQLEDTSKLDQLSNKVVLFQGQIAEKEASLAKAQKAISDEKSKVVKLIEDGKKPMAEMSQLKALLANKDQELEKLDQKNAQNEATIEDLSKQLEVQVVDLKSQSESIKNLEGQLQDQSENEKLQKQIEALKATNDHQQTQIAEQHTLVDEKKKEVEILSGKLGQKDALLEKIESENNALQTQNTKDAADIEKLRDQLADTSAADAMQQQLNEVKSILSTKQTQLDESHDANVAKQKRIDELEHYLGEKESDIARLNDQIKDLEQGVFKRSQQIEVLHQQLQDHSEIDDVKQKLGIFQSNLSSKESELSTISNTLKQKVERIEDLESLLADRDGQIAGLVRLDEELAETKQTYALLHNDFLQHQKKVKELEANNTGKQQRIEELEKFLSETHQELNHVRAKLDDSSELENLKAELEKKQEAHSASLSECANVQKELETKQTQLDESYHEVQRLRRELEDTTALDQLHHELEVKDAQLREKEEVMVALQNKINESDHKLHTLQAQVVDPAEISALQSGISEKEARIGELSEEKNQLSEKNELVQRQLHESHLEVERLRKQLADTSQMDAINKDIQRKHERIELLLKENESKHQKVLELEKSIIQKSDEIATLKQTLANTSEVDDLKEQIKLKILEVNAHRQDAEVAQAKAQELEIQRNQHLTEIANLNSELKRNLAKLADTKHVEDLQQQLDHKVGFIHNLNAETTQKQDKIVALERDLAEKEASIKRLQLQVEDSTEADAIREALNIKTVELNKLTKMMEKKEAMLNDLEAALNNAKSELLTIKSTLSDTSEVDGLKQQLVEKNKQIDELHQQTVSHQDELVSLKSSLHQKQSELERAIAKANDSSEIDLLKEKLQEKEGRVKFLDDKAQMTSARLEELEQRVAARDTELIKLQAQVADTSKLDKLTAELSDKESQVSSLEERSVQREDQISKLESRLLELDSKLDNKQQEVVELQSQLNELTKQSMLASFGSNNVEQHPDKGVIYTKEPEEKDNLGDIFGVSDDLQDQLNKMGIYKLKQIALWGGTQISYFQAELDFDGNIKREQWTVQAQRLLG